MLKNYGQQGSVTRFGAKAIVVRGQRFNNSAAKFWTALADELYAEHSGCRRVMLEALHEGCLAPEMLFPEIELERALNRSDLSLEKTGSALQAALAELELYGPPGCVIMRLELPAGQQKQQALPMDCVDAEIFLYLLAWLLEWSELPLVSWHEPLVNGSFAATDPIRRLKYLFDFTLEKKPVSEGLFAWRLDLGFARNAFGPVFSASDNEVDRI